MAVVCVLPARLASERLPRKPLQRLADRPLIEWSWLAAMRVPGVHRVIVATDSEEVAAAVDGFGGEAVLTHAHHPSGTDRVAEVAASLDADVIVNFQADEPFLRPSAVAAAVSAVAAGAPIATLACAINTDDEWSSPDIVKVARAESGNALYFSRSTIPYDRGRGGRPALGEALRHVGLYAYTREALARWVALEPSALERTEKLEQLRPLEAGLDIHVCVTDPMPPGIDVPTDLGRAEALLRASPEYAYFERKPHV